MSRALPAGTVTFVFTDIEGSTKLLHALGAEGYAAALAEHRRILRAAFAAHGGVEVDTQGDAFFVAFPTAPGALAAAEQSTAALLDGPIRVRMGVHTGTPYLTDEGYVGSDVHRAARIAAAGHGGQVLVSASTAALVDAAGLRDLGEHRFKDLSAPERVCQVGDTDFPPLRTLFRTNLPIPATGFIGRSAELAVIRDLISRSRLVTLTGPGGTGKTRLALHAAADSAEDYPQGVFWVPLAPVRDPALVLEAARQALGAQVSVAEYIADKPTLLVLDNFEHVIDAAEDVAALVAACPGLHVVVTSRELLRVPGETAYPVPPLEAQDGTALFLSRARATMPDVSSSEAIERLCSRLENLPLALELAAGRLRVLSPEQLLERLSTRLDLLKAGRGVDPRQQTLRATIEWSHDLLDAEEQQLFARLAVFVGGCTLEAAEVVCEADLDVLQSLVDKSLVRVRDGDRFWMLETIREFAIERLEASGAAMHVRRQHAEHVSALVEQAEPHLLGVDPKEWLDRLGHEHNNINVALDWLAASGDTESALWLAGSVWEYWCLRTHRVEGMQRLDRLLDAEPQPTAARAKALSGLVHLAGGYAEDPAMHRDRAQEALSLQRQFGDAWAIAFAEFQVACSLIDGGDFANALPLFEQSVQRLHDVGDEHRAIQSMRWLAWCLRETGEVEASDAMYGQMLVAARATKDGQMEAAAQALLSVPAMEEGRFADALTLIDGSYRFNRAFGDQFEVAVDLLRFARALTWAGRPAEAVHVLACADAFCQQHGVAYPDWVRRGLWDDAEARARVQLDKAAYDAAWASGSGLSPDDAADMALIGVGPSAQR